MKIPEGMTEQQVLAVIDNVANRLANKFKFGYHEADDMKQEARIVALEKLESYDGKRPLENFLYVCVHNGLYNIKRNKFARPDKPCLDCPLYDPNCLTSDNQCNAFSDKHECVPYLNWVSRNESKKNLMRPIEISNVSDENEKNMRTNNSVLEQLCGEELIDMIDKYLPPEYREDFIKLRHQIKIPKARRIRIEQAVIEIMNEHIDI